MKLDVIKLDGSSTGSVDLGDEIFGLEPRADILHRVVRWQRARQQQGTHSTLGRSEVSYSTKKIYRQKGTGGARHGSRKAPIFRKGGIYKGPVPRSHDHDLPKKFRKLGLRHALSAKMKEGALVIIDSAASDGKTNALAKQIKVKDGNEVKMFSPVIRRSGTMLLDVRIERREGFNSDIEVTVEGLAVGIEQELAGIAPVSGRRAPRPVYPVSVALARGHRGQIAVPDEAVDLVELDALLAAVFADEAQLDPFGDLGEQREVRSRSVVRGTQRIGVAGPDSGDGRRTGRRHQSVHQPVTAAI